MGTDSAAPAASSKIASNQVSGNIVVPDSSIERAGQMHTNHLIFDRPGGIVPNAGVYPLSPQQLRTAYSVPSSGGSGTICIVDAFDYPTALADFNFFAATYGLPRETSTNVTASTNQVFQVVYGNGKKPRSNSGWNQEEALDIEWAHAMAPNAKIVLIEAQSNTGNYLYTSQNTAASQPNCKEISNSWGGGEASGEAANDVYFQHAGIVTFVSSGDNGGKQQYPAASPYVVAAGGTSLNVDAAGNWLGETGWSGSGGGPSSYEPKPAFQNGISLLSSKRGIPDVSSDADPNTGVAVYIAGSWYQFGGTSVACPCLAGMTNNAGHFYSSSNAQNTAIYAGLGGANFRDITSGTAGTFSCGAGWDFVTGVGAPNGIAGL